LLILNMISRLGREWADSTTLINRAMVSIFVIFVKKALFFGLF